MLGEIKVAIVGVCQEVAVAKIEAGFLCDCRGEIQVESMLIEISVGSFGIGAAKMITHSHPDLRCDLMVVIRVKAVLNKISLNSWR